MSGPPIEGTPVPAVGIPGDFITEDLACKHCGHNLRTLSTDAVCPECGTPIDYTLRGYYLKHSSPAWVHRVARGSLLLILAVVAMIVGTVGAGVWVVHVLFSSGFTPGAPPSFDLGPTLPVVTLAILPANILTVLGILFLTTPDPAQDKRRQVGGVRPWLRQSLWLYSASVVFSAILTVTPTDFLSPNLCRALVAAQIPVAVAIFVLISALTFRYFGQLMSRVPRPRLVTFARVVFWGILTCGALMTIGQVLSTGQNVRAFTAVQTPAPTSSADGMEAQPAGPVPFSMPTTAQPPTATSPYAPLGANLPPATIPALAAQAVTGCGSCLFFGFGIAGFVLNIMVCSALYGVAREAEQIAAVAPAGSG